LPQQQAAQERLSQLALALEVLVALAEPLALLQSELKSLVKPT
jgi:hypothetical protein